MSHYMLVHTWNKEDFKLVGRKVIESMPRLPKGHNMLFSYVDARQTGGWCIYDTEDPEGLKNFWDLSVPEMHTTEMTPILQFFPPGPDSYMIMHAISI